MVRMGGRSAVCRAVIATSIVWVLVDVIILFYYLEPSPTPSPEAHRGIRAGRHVENSANKELHDDKNNEDHRKVDMDVDPDTKRILERLLSIQSFGAPHHGQGGTGVSVPEDQKKEQDKRFLENQFNVLASEMISINRSLPDYRSESCKSNAQGLSTQILPKTSIIIVFHNEAWSTLLRTLHSVVNRSPRHMIEEIILIDDKSDREYLRKPLDVYLRRFPVSIQIVHLPERSGLIRARLTGSAMAKGKILLFLDAHVEVTEGWLEPLLERVAKDRKRVVAPIIDVISDDTFEYVTASDTTWGGFNWHLNFRWYPVPKRELARRGNDRSVPIQTPTIAGGLFAIDKQFFYDIGSYDEGMQVWGGENLEISFRVWMCGGSLEIHPCSRVGHVFRKQTPYTFPGGTAKVIHHNAARTAEVWMDEYKAFFYKMVPAARNVDAGDLSARVQLRNNLQCKSFKWYLENIYPEAPLPSEFKSLGAVTNEKEQTCLDTNGKKDGQPVGLQNCHGAGGNQAWALTGKGEIRSDDLCLSSGAAYQIGDAVRMEKCSAGRSNPKHIFKLKSESGVLMHVKTGKCVAAKGNEVLLNECDESKAQKWLLEGLRP
ncbi:unnamed protein product [Caenorhabditis auriculariae]|uniref:Polypeptide N-acetylgalactosaminyltransferase n=1 Tax=Caenorhabditis auriculariae TaxID=2777116 RepID=A0A8S1GY41_9PELO|nr:unnamed protein product [Caenorhabditis auriculariae]